MELARPDNLRPLSPPPRASQRDGRLDFWRGLCLVDMVIVHLAYADVPFGAFFTPVFQYYLRFAAGGFVMISGLCVGAIFFPRVLAAGNDAAARWAVYQRLWRRALQVLLIHYGVVLVWIILVASRQSFDPPGAGPHDPNLHLPLRLLNIALLRDGGDLLPLYVYMLALTPLLMALMRRRLEWLIILASVGLFILGLHHPYWLAPNKPDLSDPGRGSFPPLLWQMVFITGVLLPPVLRSFDRLALMRKLQITAVAGVGAVLVFLDGNWQNMGLAKSPVSFLFHDALVYNKIPLSFGEYLRYMTLMAVIILTTAQTWRYISRSRVVALCALLGRNSLMIYIAHLFLQEVIVAFVYRYHGDSIWWAWSAPGAIGMLALLAWAYESWKKCSRTGRPAMAPAPNAGSVIGPMPLANG